MLDIFCVCVSVCMSNRVSNLRFSILFHVLLSNKCELKELTVWLKLICSMAENKQEGINVTDEQ